MSGDTFNAFLITPNLSFSNAPNNSLRLEFDSSFRPEDNQTGRVEVSFDNGTTWTSLLSMNSSNITGGNNSLERINEHVVLTANNTTSSGTVRFRFGMVTADNDWWWAIDNVQVTAAQQGPSGEALQATLVAGPSNGTLTLNADGSFTYTANASFTGVDTFTYRATAGSASSNVATVSITVSAGTNTAPTISNIADQSTPEDTPRTVNFTVGDAQTQAANLTVTVTSSNTTLFPAGSLTLGGSGADRTLTLTPAANQSGTATITMTVSDGTLTTNDTFVMTVTAVNDAPVATADTYTATAGTALTVPQATGVLANDTDVDSTALTAVLVTGPTAAQGTLTLNANGSFTFTPAAGFTGAATFTYKVNDGTADSNTVTVTINVGSTTPTVGVAVQGTQLVITGSDNFDYVRVRPGSGNALMVEALFDNVWQARAYSPASGAFTAVVADLRGGNDHADIDAGTIPVTVTGGAGDDFIKTGAGNDTVRGDNADGTGTGIDYLETGDGNDTVNAGGGAWNTVYAGAGNDTVTLVTGGFVNAGAGDDFVTLGSSFGSVDLGEGNDTAFGSGGNDTIAGGPGADLIFGQGGDDSLDGGDGNDFLGGGLGLDVLLGSAGDDVLEGEQGNDLLAGGLGNDLLQGQDGDDLLFDGNVRATQANDTLMAILAAYNPATSGNYATLTARLTVEADAPGRDLLLGGAGLDWFWSAELVDILDRQQNERLN